MIDLPEVHALRALTPDGRLLFATRTVRLLAYGALSVVLALYLAQLGFSDYQIGLMLTCTLVGDAVISLGIATMADRLGRRRMLFVGAGLMILAGLVFALTHHVLILTLAATFGTISPSGGDMGPFLAIEQAALPQTAPDTHRTQVFAWFNLSASFAKALGALSGGALVQVLAWGGFTPITQYRTIVLSYVLLGAVIIGLISRLSAAIEADTPHQTDTVVSFARARQTFLGLHRSRRVVVKLSALFMLDSFGGGLVVQTLMAYWFAVRFGLEPAWLGGIFFGANLCAGLSALVAARLAARWGLLNTMVWTHIPSNILLMLVPLMPTAPLAIGVLLGRFSISQMDVPTRQSYIMAVVDADERSAAAGITSVARTLGSALAPLLTGAMLSASLLSLPFVFAGGLKTVYDVLLYHSFRAVKPPEEQKV
jgi:MFS family permease